MTNEAHPVRVIIESPYRGDVERNMTYLRRAMHDAVKRGESPYASHGLLTQPGVLDDDDPIQRERGIKAGYAWWSVAERIVFYTDYGWSDGMNKALYRCNEIKKPYEVREIGFNLGNVSPSVADALKHMKKSMGDSRSASAVAMIGGAIGATLGAKLESDRLLARLSEVLACMPEETEVLSVVKFLLERNQHVDEYIIDHMNDGTELASLRDALVLWQGRRDREVSSK